MKKQQAPAPTIEHSLKLRSPAGLVDVLLSQKGRRFTVLHAIVVGNPDLTLAFHPTGTGIENKDLNSDAAQVFNVSTHIKVGSVDLTWSEMIAPSFEELKSVLSSVKIRAFNHEEI